MLTTAQMKQFSRTNNQSPQHTMYSLHLVKKIKNQ